MNVRHSYLALMIAVVVLGGPACKSQNTAEEQKKVDDLQGQLDAAKQQLATKEKEIEAKAAEAQAVAEENAKRAAARQRREETKTARGQGCQQGPGRRVASDQGAVARDLADRQGEVNAQQSDTNDRVQREIEALKPVEYRIPAGTVIPVRTTTELSTSQLATGSTFTAVLERDLSVGGTVLAAAGRGGNRRRRLERSRRAGQGRGKPRRHDPLGCRPERPHHSTEGGWLRCRCEEGAPAVT